MCSSLPTPNRGLSSAASRHNDQACSAMQGLWLRQCMSLLKLLQNSCSESCKSCTVCWLPNIRQRAAVGCIHAQLEACSALQDLWLRRHVSALETVVVSYCSTQELASKSFAPDKVRARPASGGPPGCPQSHGQKLVQLPDTSLGSQAASAVQANSQHGSSHVHRSEHNLGLQR